jgi:hypothetical protein
MPQVSQEYTIWLDQMMLLAETAGLACKNNLAGSWLAEYRLGKLTSAASQG